MYIFVCWMGLVLSAYRMYVSLRNIQTLRLLRTHYRMPCSFHVVLPAEQVGDVKEEKEQVLFAGIAL